MAGIHGKNATIRISSTETILSGVAMTGTNGGAFQVASGSRDWRYDRENTLIQFSNDGVQGYPADVDVALNTQTRLINYAAGAVHLGQYPAVHSGVFAMAVSMQLAAIGNLVGDSRNFSVTINSDSIDSTVIGESWRTFEDGLLGFEGTLEGLIVDNFWYKRAVATLSGLLPRTVLRLQIDPKYVNSYYQGTVIFPSFELNGGFDSVVEYSVPFQGRGPLDLIERGVAYFKVHETS